MAKLKRNQILEQGILRYMHQEKGKGNRHPFAGTQSRRNLFLSSSLRLCERLALKKGED